MKKRIILIIILLFIVTIVSTIFINMYMIKSTESNIISINNVDEYSDIDAILVLGCKVEENSPSMMLKNRLEKAIEVYKKLDTKLLLSGDHGKNKYDEVNVMRDYLLDSNIDSKDIFLDHAGFSTYDSIYRAKYIFNVKKMIIITQKYHLYRALYIAKGLGIEAYGIEALDLPYKSIMIKNEIREILSRDKNFIKMIFKPQSKYLGDQIPLDGDSNLTRG